MFDTTPEIDEKVRELFLKKTPVERLEMGCSMFNTTKKLLIRFILEENPEITQVGLKQQLFLKLYGDEFTQDQVDKIFCYFSNSQ